MSRRVYLTWVLAACELSGPERLLIRGLVDQEPPGPEYDARRGLTPTMMYQSAVEKLSELPESVQDGRARVVLEDERTYVSVAGFGWVPLTLH